MAESLEELLAKAKELSETYAKLSETHIPRSIKEARESGWDLEPTVTVVSNLIGYPLSDRKHDSQRCIRLSEALRIIEDFEDELLVSTVSTPKEVFVSKVRGIVRIVQFSLDAFPILWEQARGHISVWDILDLLAWIARLGFITDLFNGRTVALVETIIELVRRWAGLVFAGILTAFGLDVFNGSVLAVQKHREAFAGKMRKAALPQRSVHRVYRQRVSRL